MSTKYLIHVVPVVHTCQHGSVEGILAGMVLAMLGKKFMTFLKLDSLLRDEKQTQDEKQSNTPERDGSVEGGIPVTKSIISDTRSEYFFKNKIT